MADTYKLTYFNYRGTAEPIRMIFKVANIPFEDKRLEWDDAWRDEHKQKFPWGTLPVLQIGEDLLLCHHIPIARFLARKFKLDGKTEIDAARCDELVEAMKDLRDESMKVFVENDPDKKDKLRTTFLNVTTPGYLSRFEKVYQANSSPWLVGQGMTWADIYIVCSFDNLTATLGEEILLDVYPGLKDLKEKVYGVPEIKKYLETRPTGTY